MHAHNTLQSLLLLNIEKN